MIFRELHNQQPIRELKLGFIENQRLRLTELERPTHPADILKAKNGRGGCRRREEPRRGATPHPHGDAPLAEGRLLIRPESRLYSLTQSE